MILPRLRTATWYLSLLLLATATLAPARAQDEPKHPVNTLNGVVVRQSDGKPLALTNVMVEMPGPQHLTLGALTDDQGRFVIKNLRPGKHKLRLLRHAPRVGPG